MQPHAKAQNQDGLPLFEGWGWDVGVGPAAGYPRERNDGSSQNLLDTHMIIRRNANYPGGVHTSLSLSLSTPSRGQKRPQLFWKSNGSSIH